MHTNNIWCVGRNYQQHAQELGNPVPSEPMIFLKAGSCIVSSEKVELPTSLGEIHYELELALKFDAQKEFCAYALALDLTARQKQSELKHQKAPWTLAKSFKNSCPISSWRNLNSISELENQELRLFQNGELKQAGFTHQMIFPLKELRNYILSYFPVVENDILLTGTPAGVGPIHSGDLLSASFGSLLNAQWTFNA